MKSRFSLRHLFLTALILNLVLIPLPWTGIFKPFHIEDPFLFMGAIGTVLSIVQLVGAVGSGRVVSGLMGAFAALILGVGWGSWFFVGLTSDPDGAIINVAGLLVAPGVIITALALVAYLLETRAKRHTYAWIFALTAVAWFFLAYFVFPATFVAPFDGVVTLGLGILQIVLAARARTGSLARVLAALTGIAFIFGSLASGLWLWPNFAFVWLAVAALGIVAALAEFQALRRSTELDSSATMAP